MPRTNTIQMSMYIKIKKTNNNFFYGKTFIGYARVFGGNKTKWPKQDSLIKNTDERD
jgi:hypothetical protein